MRNHQALALMAPLQFVTYPRSGFATAQWANIDPDNGVAPGLPVAGIGVVPLIDKHLAETLGIALAGEAALLYHPAIGCCHGGCSAAGRG